MEAVTKNVFLSRRRVFFIHIIGKKKQKYQIIKGGILPMKKKILAIVLSFAMISTVSTMTASAIVPTDPTNPIKIGTSENYTILSKTGISSAPNSYVYGNIGVNPISETAITGFSLKMDASNEFSSSTQVEGQVFAGNYGYTTSRKLNAAVSDMETAYIVASGRTADFTDLYDGDLSGKTLSPGVYKWNSGVVINTDVTLDGDHHDVFVFIVAEGITQAAWTEMKFDGEVGAKNIFWIVGENVFIGDNSYFQGNVIGKANVVLGTNTIAHGRLLVQNEVTLVKSSVIKP